MMLLEALSDPTKLNEQQTQRLASVGLLDTQGSTTQLGKRILANPKDQTAIEELSDNQARLMPIWEVDWVTQASRNRGNTTFGPATGCGDMAAYSMGF